MASEKIIRLKKNQDGSQQYVRGDDIIERLDNITKAIRASSEKGKKQNRALTLLSETGYNELTPKGKAAWRKFKGDEQRRALAEGRRYPAAGARYKKGGAVVKSKSTAKTVKGGSFSARGKKK